MINNATINHILERVRARGDSERERRRERERAMAQAAIQQLAIREQEREQASDGTAVETLHGQSR